MTDRKIKTEPAHTHRTEVPNKFLGSQVHRRLEELVRTMALEIENLNEETNRMLKKSETALLVETKARLYVSAYARNRYPTEFDVQLPVAGRACTGEPSVAADSADGR
jgi:hypothetical protein